MKVFIGTIVAYIAMIATGCNHKREVVRPIFLYQELQDSVEQFVKETQFPDDSLGKNIIQVIIAQSYESDRDTLVIVRLPTIGYSLDRDVVIGAAWLGGRICEVIYSGSEHLPSLVEEDSLTIPQNKYDYYAGSHLSEREWREIGRKFLRNTFKVYRLRRPEPLVLLIKNGKSLE